MIGPAELHECGRCGVSGRDVRSTLAYLEREARLDGRLLEGPRYAIEYRCAACRASVRPKRETNRE